MTARPTATLRRMRALVAVVATALLLAGCASSPSTGTDGSSAGSSGSPSEPTNLTGDLTVYAAASLTASFDDLASEFEKVNPSVTVKPIDFDGSSTLATQLIQGAPADVFASADQATMNKVVKPGLIDGTGTAFASNTLQIAVQPGNPKHISGLADLANPGLTVVLCAPQVPCGSASHKLLDADGVAVKPASEEQNVTAVITKVKSGDADAGLVYVTDVKASAGAVDGVTIADAGNDVNSYPIAALKDAPNPAAAKAFVAFVLSDAGQKVLAKYGFGTP